MSKVKLILDDGLIGYGKVSDVVLTLSAGERVRGVIETDFEPNSAGERRASDGIDLVIYIEDINNLVGRIKTLLEASISDPEQRKASKDIFNNEIWSWYTGRSENLGRTWRFNKGYESEIANK